MDIKLKFWHSNFCVCLLRTKYSLIYTAEKKTNIQEHAVQQLTWGMTQYPIKGFRRLLHDSSTESTN